MKIRGKKEQIIIWMTGILFLILFSYTTSPLFPDFYGWDSAFFMLVGKGMTRGSLPYRDFFDMKGPWLFLIEYAGQLICYDRNGIFMLQCLSLGITLFFCQKILERYYGSGGLRKSLLALLPFYIILSSTMEGGNLTEEWSLPFLFFCLYLALEFIHGGRKQHRPGKAFWYGLCFGILALIRITNAALICAIILTVFIFLVQQREWKNLFWNMLAFLGGVLLAFLPPVIYFGMQGQLENMLYCTFVFGFIYGTEGFAWGTGMAFLVSLLLPAGALWITGEKNRKLWTLVLANLAGMLVVLGLGNSTLHDYMLILPGVMLGIWQLMKDGGVRSAYGGKKKWQMIALLTVCCIYPGYKLAGTGAMICRQASDHSSWQNVMETAECIPAKERDLVWGYEIPLRWYTIADIMPYSRYCGWQEHYMALSPRIAEEIEEMMDTAPPEWIVCKASAALTNQKMISELEEHYAVYTENEEYVLYQRTSE